MPEELCFRCNEELIVIEELEEITFYKCTNCKRDYAKALGKTLTDRWMSPISIALYGIIFEKEIVPDEFISYSIKSLVLNEAEKKQMIEEIEEELSNPKQKLVDMLDLKGTEEIARDYLRRLSIALQNQ